MLDMAAAMPMGWMHRSIGFAVAKGLRREGGGGGGEGLLSNPFPLKIPQMHLFSAYVFRFAGPPPRFDLTSRANKPQQRPKAGVPGKTMGFH